MKPQHPTRGQSTEIRAVPTARPASPETVGPSHAHRKWLPLRRTVIPLLVTMTVLLPALGILFMLLEADSAFRTLPAWTPLALIAGGTVTGALGWINILHVGRARRAVR